MKENIIFHFYCATRKGMEFKMSKINEKELSQLFAQIKANNEIAFEKLYNTYNKLVYGIAFSMLRNKQDAEDVTQIVFTKIYSIDKNKLPTKNEASWLYSTTKNETLNFLRKRNNNINLDNIYELEDSNNEINTIIDNNSYYKIISGLNDKEKEIISLKILANLSFDEISKMLKTPTGTIKWKYYKSIHTLKILLSNLGMFIITAFLSIATLKKDKKLNLPIKNETNKEDNENFREENAVATPPKETTEETKKEDNSQTQENVTEKDDSQAQENVTQEGDSQTQENTTEQPISSNNTNYISIGLMGISIMFFIITIIFSIIFAKHQLKRRKKLSK